MSHLEDIDSPFLASAYAVSAVFLTIDAALLGFRLRRVSARRPSHDDGDDDDAPVGQRVQGARCRWMSTCTPALGVCLCLSLLAISFAELFLPQGRSEIRKYRWLAAVIWTRMAFAAAAGACLVARSSNVWKALQGGGGDGMGLYRALTKTSLAGVAIVLLWRAVRLTAAALFGFPHVEALVYVEGYCAVGSIAVVGALLAQQLSGTGIPLEESEEDRRPCQVEAREWDAGTDTLGWASLISFSWLNPLFETGASRQLRPEDLPGLAGRDRTKLWVERFEAVLGNERGHPRRRPSLLRACRTAFGREFLSLGWFKAANTGLGFSGPLLLKVVVDAVQEISQSEDMASRRRAAIKGYLGAAGLVATFALSAVLDTQFSLRLGRLQLHVRASLVSAVYRQVLNVRSVDASELGLTAGGATNLIAVDAQRLMDTAGSLHELWGLPVQVGITFYLLYREVSFAFAAGLVVIVAMIPLNTALAKRIGAASRELMTHKDERVERCSEMLRGISAVKMLAWEGYIKQRVEDSRKNEVSALSALKIVDAWCVFFWATTPTLVCLATFATLVAVRGEAAAPLKTSSVFAAVSLLQMLIHPMNAFPWVVNGVVEAVVSKGRLEKLLLPAAAPDAPSRSRTTTAAATTAGGGPDKDAIVFWRGVTVALSRCRQRWLHHGEESSGRGITVPVPSSSSRDEVAAGVSSSEADFLEPLLPRVAPDGEECGDDSLEEGGGEEKGDSGKRLSGFALRGVDFEVRRGEAVAIVGEVGSGKSTLLSGILGEIPVFLPPGSSRARSHGVDSLAAGSVTAGGSTGGPAAGVASKPTESSNATDAHRARPTAATFQNVLRDRSGQSHGVFDDDVKAGSNGGDETRMAGNVRAETACYSAQTPWVMSGTVRDNVLFGLPMAEELYREVLEACALGEDLASITGGDMAYVGERGATLSGGQRLRVSLARCAYAVSVAHSCHTSHISRGRSEGSVLCLLDDPLSSLDTRTRRHVFERCVHGLLRRNPAAAVVVVVNEGGGEDGGETNRVDEGLHGMVDGRVTDAKSYGAYRGPRRFVFDRVFHMGASRGIGDHTFVAVQNNGNREHAASSLLSFDTTTAGVQAISTPAAAVAAATAAVPSMVTTGESDVCLGRGLPRVEGNKEQQEEKKEEKVSVHGGVRRTTEDIAIDTTSEAFDVAVAVLDADAAKVGDGKGWKGDERFSGGERQHQDPHDDAQHRTNPFWRGGKEEEGKKVEVEEKKEWPRRCYDHDDVPPLPRMTGPEVEKSEDGEGVWVGGVACESVSGGGGGPRSVEGQGKEKGQGNEQKRDEIDLEDERAAGVGRDAEGDDPVEDEERKYGSVELQVYLLYVRSAGLRVTLMTLISLGLMQGFSAGFRYWLSYWATHQGRISVGAFLLVSSSIAVSLAVFTLLRAFGFAWAGISAAVSLHRRLLARVIVKPASFFDVTPSGRIVNRFSRDAFSVDDPLPFHLNILLAQASGLLATAGVLCMTSPLIILLFAPLGVVYGRLQRYYRSTSRELRRLDSTSRSPIYALFSETLEGAVTIRAFAQKEFFTGRFVRLLAANQRATFTGSMSSAWLSLRLQSSCALHSKEHKQPQCILETPGALGFLALGVAVVAAVAFLAVAEQHIRRVREAVVGGISDARDDDGALNASPGNYEALVGLSLTYALPIVGNLTGLLGALTDTEREMISVERMDEYCQDDATEHPSGGDDSNERNGEVDTVSSNRKGRGTAGSLSARAGVMSAWPDTGRLEVVDVVMRYRAYLNPSLNGINMVVQAGEKVGIVGRTGSGKTSLLRVLFRMYPYAGSIKLDGVDIATMPAGFLRSRLAVIPQEPLLFGGTIRDSLDPSGEHSDAALWQALHRSGLTEPRGRRSVASFNPSWERSASQPSHNLIGGNRWPEGDGRDLSSFQLDTVLKGSGSNISEGQRQLLCVARALLKRSKLVCVDEATSRMDATVAEMVDATMAEVFQDATVLTVAHRLPLVVEKCDRVVVMSEGRLIEDGNPRELAKKPMSKFRELLHARS